MLWLVHGYMDPGVFVCKTAMLYNTGRIHRMRALRASLQKARADFHRAQHCLDHVAARVFLGTTVAQGCTKRESLQMCLCVLNEHGYKHHVDDDGVLQVFTPTYKPGDPVRSCVLEPSNASEPEGDSASRELLRPRQQQ